MRTPIITPVLLSYCRQLGTVVMSRIAASHHQGKYLLHAPTCLSWLDVLVLFSQRLRAAGCFTALLHLCILINLNFINIFFFINTMEKSGKNKACGNTWIGDHDLACNDVTRKANFSEKVRKERKEKINTWTNLLRKKKACGSWSWDLNWGWYSKECWGWTQSCHCKALWVCLVYTMESWAPMGLAGLGAEMSLGIERKQYLYRSIQKCQSFTCKD